MKTSRFSVILLALFGCAPPATTDTSDAGVIIFDAPQGDTATDVLVPTVDAASDAGVDGNATTDGAADGNATTDGPANDATSAGD